MAVRAESGATAGARWARVAEALRKRQREAQEAAEKCCALLQASNEGKELLARAKGPERAKRASLRQFVREEKRRAPCNAQSVRELEQLQRLAEKTRRLLSAVEEKLAYFSTLSLAEYFARIERRQSRMGGVKIGRDQAEEAAAALACIEAGTEREDAVYAVERYAVLHESPCICALVREASASFDGFTSALFKSSLSEDVKTCIDNGVVLSYITFRSAVLGRRGAALFLFSFLCACLGAWCSAQLDARVHSESVLLLPKKAACAVLQGCAVVFSLILSLDLSSFVCDGLARQRQKDPVVMFHRTVTHMAIYYFLQGYAFFAIFLSSFCLLFILRLSVPAQSARGCLSLLSNVFATCVFVRALCLLFCRGGRAGAQQSRLYRVHFLFLHALFLALYAALRSL